MIAKTILAITLITSGWQPPPPPGPVVGKSYSQSYCAVTIGDDPVYVLPEPICFPDEYYLYTDPCGFRVSKETWDRYELGDSYP